MFRKKKKNYGYGDFFNQVSERIFLKNKMNSGIHLMMMGKYQLNEYT